MTFFEKASMKQNLKDALGLLDAAVSDATARINVARDRLALKTRAIAGESDKLARGLEREREKVRRALAEVRELSVSLKNGEI
jgi:hypothetical protein